MNGHKKRTSLAAGSMAAMLSCILLFSCNNEDLFENKKSENTCDNICFGITPREKAQTRGDVGGNEVGYTSERFVLRSEDSADTLCMRAVVSEGINSSALDSKRVITRGVPVTSDNFDAFHVVAYWKKNNDLQSQFYMDVDATKKGNNLWSSEQTYYWPGAGNTLQFVAWTPAKGLLPPSTPDRTLSYTVPKEAANQQDIVVATTGEIGGDYNKEVPLTFQHICTAVRFVVGSQMQPGTIKSVALKGVNNVGTYKCVIPGAWELNKTSTDDFSQVLDKEMTGSETDGTEVTTGEGTFMMLPQTLPADAKVEVVFINANNVERTLTASIGNATWKMGTTVTYKLSITPEYELEFSKDNPTEVDAHYIIVPIKINAKELNNGNYTVVASNPEICKLRESLIGPEKQGYWPKETTAEGDFVRKKSVSSDVEGETLCYAFLTENTTEAGRDVILELQYNNKTVRTMTIIQKCPNWISDIGWEHIEEDGLKPFGFAWTRKVKYESNNAFAGILISILRLFGIIDNNPAVSFSGLINVSCTIDYSKVQSLSNVFSETDGLANTKGFSANSASTLTSLESTLGSLCKIVSESGENINSTDFAALVCLKKNACNVEKQTTQKQVAYLPSYEDADINWYLPASGQFTDNKAGLSGQYWSSTAIDDNINAYSWNTLSQSTSRMEFHKVRAVRKKP